MSFLATLGNSLAQTKGNIDYITFVGDGEPTLSIDLGLLIRRCKRNFSYRTAVITNGSLFWQKEVRDDLMDADVVSITMANQLNAQTFHRMHRCSSSLRGRM